MRTIGSVELYVLVTLETSCPYSLFTDESKPFVVFETVAVAAWPEHEAAVVAFVALVAFVAFVALVAFVAVSALTAFVALSACLTIPLAV